MLRRTLAIATTLAAAITVAAAGQAMQATTDDAARPGADAAIAGFRARHPGCGLLRDRDQLARVWGTLATGATPIDSAESFLRANAAIFGVDAADLAPVGPFQDGEHVVPLMADDETGAARFTGVWWTQQVHGVPVFRAHLLVLARNEPGFPAVLAASTLWELGGFGATLDGADLAHLPPADRWSRQAFASFPGTPTATPARYVVWAGVDRVRAAEPRLAVTFEAEWGGPADPDTHRRFLFVVDAADGRILYREDRIFHAVGGQVAGVATAGNDADACLPAAPHPLPYVGITANGSTAWADAAGNWTFSRVGAVATYVATLGGRFFSVQDNGGTPLAISQSVSPGGTWNPTFNADDAQASARAQVNAYLHANEMRDLALSVSPSYPAVATQASSFVINVNLASTCNAYYTAGTINFYAAGGGCANTAFGSVVEHEYGHNLVEKGGSGQGAYGEGMGDACSVLDADDPRIGVGFQACDAGLRNAANQCRYDPYACSTCGNEMHLCGQVLSGSIWDLRTLLQAAHPADYRRRLAALTVNSILLHGAVATIGPDVVVDFLVLNDDNGTIADGTPDYPLIASAFAGHGLQAPPLQLLAFAFPEGQPDIVATDGTTPIRVQVSALSGTLAPGTAQLWVRAGADTAFRAYPMTQVAPGTYEGHMPAAACTAPAAWYVSAGTTSGQVQTSPVDAPTHAYAAVYGQAPEVLYDDSFESAQPGWTAGAPGDTAFTGAWVRGDPSGTTAQPEDDHTPGDGVSCWFTGQGPPGGGVGDADVDGGTATLVSPAYDCSGFDNVYVSYWRWYSNDEGANPNTNSMPVEVSVDDGATWRTLELVTENAGTWVRKTFRLNDVVAPSSTVRLRWVARDLTGAVVEAAVDDLRIFGTQCATTKAADLNGDGAVNGADLGVLLGHWGQGGIGDLNGDGVVDGLDLGILLGSWG